VNEITVSAEHEGARVIAEARAEAQRLREEVDDYVDTALANFEQFLTRALGLDRTRPGQDARAAGDRHVPGRGERAPAAVLNGLAALGWPAALVG
jgi:hypothetical protein